MDDLVNAPKFS